MTTDLIEVPAPNDQCEIGGYTPLPHIECVYYRGCSNFAATRPCGTKSVIFIRPEQMPEYIKLRLIT